MEQESRILQLSLPGKRGNDVSASEQLAMFKQMLMPIPKEVHTRFGVTKSASIEGRLCVIHYPYSALHQRQADQTFHLLVFLHGSRGFCWQSALLKTRFIQMAEKQRLIIVFGQAVGQATQEPYLDSKYGGFAFGQRYWEIRNGYEEFYDDIHYVRKLVKLVQSSYKIGKKFLAGHSNGGVFATEAAIFMRDEFDAFYSSMGGMGNDLYVSLDFDKAAPKFKGYRLPRLYFYTGHLDVHRQCSIVAAKIFKDEKYEVILDDEKGIKHLYQYKVQQKVLDYFFKEDTGFTYENQFQFEEKNESDSS